MKVKFWCDNGANIHSCKWDIFDIEEDLNISIDEWKEMSEEDKVKLAEEWASDSLDIGYEELD